MTKEERLTALESLFASPGWDVFSEEIRGLIQFKQAELVNSDDEGFKSARIKGEIRGFNYVLNSPKITDQLIEDHRKERDAEISGGEPVGSPNDPAGE